MLAHRSPAFHVALVLVLCACEQATTDSPPSGAPHDAREVTAVNLLEHERYWPYRVTLVEPVAIAGREQPLRANRAGVLIRVESSGAPRIDFGSHGIHEIPVGQTDLLARANAIRTGRERKPEPNFVHAIRARMLDPVSEPVKALPSERVVGRPGFLCVFADPTAAEFEALARSLAPLDGRHQVMTILFPQGRHGDPEVASRLRALEWAVPFLASFLSEPYTRTLRSDGAPLPWLLLQTAEGRIVHQGGWSPDPSALIAALDESFGPASEFAAGPSESR